MLRRSSAFVFILLIGFSGSLFAQEARVRVLRDQSIIWNLSAATPITTVRAGTELDVVAREGEFFIVRVAAGSGRPETLGRIAIAQVTLIQGVSPPDTGLRTTTTPAGPGIGVYGFAQAGLQRWLAHETFAAVLGSANAPMFGFGGQLRVRDQILVEAAVERFEKVGERVFVNNGEVFKLGIRDTVRITPISFTVSYREQVRRFGYYAGAGFGRYLYKEDSDFADPQENVDTRFTSYHVVGGVELNALRSFVKTAIEVQYTTVPDAIGVGGASAAFGERNLGGVQVRAKVLVGR